MNLLGYKRTNSRHPGKDPDIYINPAQIAAVIAQGDGQANVILTNGIAYEIARGAAEIAADVIAHSIDWSKGAAEVAAKPKGKTFAQQQAEALAGAKP